jgi:type IV pilus assembly protein PilB
VAVKDDYLLDTLIDLGYVTHDQVTPVRADAEASGEGIVDLLVTRKVIPPTAVTQAKATYFNAEVVQLSDLRLPDEVVQAIPRHVAKRYRVVPVYRHDGAIGVALSDPSDLDTIDALHHLLRLEIEPKVASDEDLEAALNKYYGAADDSVGKMIQDITEGDVEIQAPGGAVENDSSTEELPGPLPH